jgi:hypothetical protein
VKYGPQNAYPKDDLYLRAVAYGNFCRFALIGNLYDTTKTRASRGHSCESVV